MAQIIEGTYEIYHEIGAGGGGIVYLGRHLRLDKTIVLKADKRRLGSSKEAQRREVDVLKNLNHNYLPQVYDFIQEGDTVYTVMDYVEGESLDKVLKRGERIPQATVIRWACQLLDALRYLHTRPPYGILHADIKPANIMLRPNGDICLIDFNIALALKENGAVQVGFSMGYASPEHYGLSYVSEDRFFNQLYTDINDAEQKGGVRHSNDRKKKDDNYTALTQKASMSGTSYDSGSVGSVPDNSKQSNTESRSRNNTSSSKSSSYRSVKTNVTLDVRSDIYSLGATLYHLFSGTRPARHADEVIPLGADVVSPSISAILEKAMAPPRELRYGSADEMLKAFLSLYKNDPRTIRRKRAIMMSAAAISVIFLVGGGLTFTGLRKRTLRQEALTLSEYSANALSNGDVSEAIRLALDAIPEKEGFFSKPLTAEAQKALTDALGVYDLSESYQAFDSIKLPSSPFRIIKSPNGTRFAVVYAYNLEVYDVGGKDPLVTLPVMESSLSTACFTNEDIIIYTGKDGLTAYDISSGKTLWIVDPATFVTLSGDGKRVAAANGENDEYCIYDTDSGKIIIKGSFQGNHMAVPYNDNFADVGGRIFALNHDGSRLAVSFSNGGLWIFCPTNPMFDLIRYDDSTYQTFEGAFNGDSFYYIAADSTDGSANSFEIIDYLDEDIKAGLESSEAMRLSMENNELYTSEGNTLVRIDPDTLDQTEIVFTGDSKIHAFSVGEGYSLIATDDKAFSFYDSGGHLSTSVSGNYLSDYLCLAGDYAIIGNGNEPSVRRFKLEKPNDDGSWLYDARQEHVEARICPDGEHLILFDNDAYHTYDKDGKLLREDSFPDPDKIYDTQFQRGDGKAYLEVTWYDGTVRHYDVLSGEVTDEKSIDPPSEDLFETFETSRYRIESALHYSPEVYEKDSGKLLGELKEDAYLTYVTEVDDYIIMEYVSTESGQDSRFGLLLNQDLETLAYLPNLCDIYEGSLVFDYGSGVLRKSPIYSLDELIRMGKEVIR